MTYMPVWYQQGRSALLLLQSVIGLLLVSYPLKRRSHFLSAADPVRAGGLRGAVFRPGHLHRG